MFSRVADFSNVWKYETDATLKLFDKLTDASLAQPAHKDARSLGRVAWHITTTLPEMCNRCGFSVSEPDPQSPVPQKIETIRAQYKKAAGAIAEQVKKWSDADLLKEDNMYGETWKRGSSLFGLIVHQAHHRGQMTVLLRMANLPVTGVYGPAKEEWSQMGMTAPEV